MSLYFYFKVIAEQHLNFNVITKVLICMLFNLIAQKVHMFVLIIGVDSDLFTTFHILMLPFEFFIHFWCLRGSLPINFVYLTTVLNI